MRYLGIVSLIVITLLGFFGARSHGLRAAKDPAAAVGFRPSDENASRPLAATHQTESTIKLVNADLPVEFANGDPGESSWSKELRQLKELAKKNPDAALTQVAQMSEKHERKTAAKTVCLVLANTDPAKATKAAWDFKLGQFADESEEYTALENLAKQWAEVDLVKAFVWASALPADDEWRRDRVVKGIASALAEIAPEEAARLIAQQISPGSSVQIDAAVDVLHDWAARDYPAALTWAALFPEGPLRERGLEELASSKPRSVVSGAEEN